MRKKSRNTVRKLFLISVMGILFLIFGGTYKKVLAETPWEEAGLMKPYLTSLEVTPIGMFAGELNPNYWELPYNGIHFSPTSSNGTIWQKTGLKNQGVTDIYYAKEKIYATTMYSSAENTAGLYESSDWGKNWTNIGINTPAKSVAVAGDSILLGTYTQGLWRSTDSGQTWTKVELFVQEDEPIYRVEDIFILEDIIYVKAYGGIKRFFSSQNNGETWEREFWLETFDAHDIWEYDNLLYVGTEWHGIIVSKDYKTMHKVLVDLAHTSNPTIYKSGTYFFLASVERESNRLEIYISKDQGRNWQSTGLLEITNARGTPIIKGTHGTDSWIFALIPNKGIYRKKIIFSKEKEPFLGSLWENQKPNQLLNKITSFFDHEYPLFGYSLFAEQKDIADKTLNFLGQEGKEPEIYYSSHNGYDFALPFGTKITAPADGLLSGHYCISCGNMLYIDHPNGYRTVYMHLQSEGLKAQSWEKNIPVKEGDVLGKVGMTGNTTGPHLHFQVHLISNSNIFLHPKSLIDPFGWWNNSKHDPFALLQWEDVLGTHSGNSSKYLWKEEITLEGVKKAFSGQPLLLDLNNVNIQIPSGTHNLPLAFHLAYSTPPTPPDKKLEYAQNSSITIQAYELSGEKISQLKDFITVRIALSMEELTNIKIDTLAIYHFNEITKLWEKLESVFYEDTLFIEAQTDSISSFAVFGEKLEQTEPTTTVLYTGNSSDHWFTEYPLVTMSTEPNCRIFYSLFGEFWEEYTQPFYIEQEGIVRLRYRSMRPNGETESVRVAWVRIDTMNKVKKTMFIYGTQLNIQ